MITELTIDHVENLAHRMAQRLLEFDEPIPDFKTRFEGRLESCLKTPWQTYNEKQLYPKLEDKAAMLFYLLIKNHPFQNGNKRIAVASLFVFLEINGCWLNIVPDDLFRIAVWIAESMPVTRRGALQAIRDVLQKNIIEWKKLVFRDGQILHSKELNNIRQAILVLQALHSIPRLPEFEFKNGEVLRAEDLNLMMAAIDELRSKLNLKPLLWEHMPVAAGKPLRASSLNEMAGSIKKAVDEMNGSIQDGKIK